MLGVIGIILSLGLLMYYAFKGVSVIILTPLLALLALVFSGSFDILPVYTQTYMSSLGGFVATYLPIFLLGAIFGKIMEKTGSAQSIANVIAKKLGKDKAVLAVVLSCAVLTYGGVSLFVVAFAVYPIAVSLFKEAGIPKRLIPGTIALGSFTFTMTAMPGTPQVQNVIPMPYFGTTTWAAPILGIIASLVLLGLGYYWLSYRVKQAFKQNEGFGNHKESNNTEKAYSKLPNFIVALLPILVMLILNYILSNYVFIKDFMDWGWLEKYNTTIKASGGTWSLVIALVVAIVLAILSNFEVMKNNLSVINEGASDSLFAILNTAAAVGYGNVIATLGSFTIIKEGLLGISSNPLIAEGISVSCLSGITGSATGGMSISLQALGDNLLQLAANAGISPEVLHRVATVACGGLDSLPHNGAVITLLAVCGLTHKKSYLDIFMVSVVIPTVALVVTIILGSMGIV